MITIERFKAYLDSKGITNAQAERDCGLSNGLIGNAFKTKTSIGSDKLEKILSTYQDLSAEWLMRGMGSMIVGQGKAKEFEDKIFTMSQNKEQMLIAYDIAISTLDIVSKSYEFYKKKGL